MADPRIEALIQLQHVVSEEDSVKRDLEEIPQRKAHLEADYKRAEEAVNIHREELKQVQVRIREAEAAIEAAKQSIAQKENQLLSLKSNKEYSAMLKEIETAKKKISDSEAKELALIDEQTEKQEVLKKEEEYLAQSRGSHERDIKELDSLLQDSEGRMREIQSRKEEVIQECDPAHVRLFERLHKGKDDGVAMVPANDGHCGGCRVKLPPQPVADAKWGQTIVRCENCSRIIYWDETQDPTD